MGFVLVIFHTNYKSRYFGSWLAASCSILFLVCIFSGCLKRVTAPAADGYCARQFNGQTQNYNHHDFRRTTLSALAHDPEKTGLVLVQAKVIETPPDCPPCPTGANCGMCPTQTLVADPSDHDATVHLDVPFNEGDVHWYYFKLLKGYKNGPQNNLSSRHMQLICIEMDENEL